MPPLGPGLAVGVETDNFIGFRPGDTAYVDHTGAVFNPQNDGGAGNIAYYEIQNTSDTIDIDVARVTRLYDNPTLVFNTVFGPTDFAVETAGGGNAIVSEQSGFDTDGWVVSVTGFADTLRLTQFDTGNGIDGTQAAWYPYINVLDLQTDR